MTGSSAAMLLAGTVLLTGALTVMAWGRWRSAAAWRALVACAFAAVALLVGSFAHDFALRDDCDAGVSDLGCR